MEEKDWKVQSKKEKRKEKHRGKDNISVYVYIYIYKMCKEDNGEAGFLL